METPKRIHLKGTGMHDEARAGAAITPGHLIMRNSDDKVIVHSPAGGAGEKSFALEDALQGRTIADDYAADEVVAIVKAQPGDHIYAHLAAGENVTPADFLTSNGDGTLKAASGDDAVIAVPNETLDLTDSGADVTRISCRIV